MTTSQNGCVAGASRSIVVLPFSNQARHPAIRIVVIAGSVPLDASDEASVSKALRRMRLELVCGHLQT